MGEGLPITQSKRDGVMVMGFLMGIVGLVFPGAERYHCMVKGRIGVVVHHANSTIAFIDIVIHIIAISKVVAGVG